MKAVLTEYASVSSSAPDASAVIQFLDPCPDPESVLSVPQSNPVAYLYTGQSPSMKFTLNAFIVEPAVCPFIYSCQVIAGGRTDLCEVSDGATEGIFEANSGNFEFYSVDMANYPPGDYTFEIRGVVGSKSATATFVMTLVVPRTTTHLTII